jgi:hypothetical protein
MEAGPQSWERAMGLARLGAGGLLLAAGGLLLVLPGPGIPLLLGGLALLAPRVAWAQRTLERMKAAVGGSSARGGRGDGGGAFA